MQTKNNPFDFFDKIYCINLPNNVERWISISEEFKKVGILDSVERIWTTPPPNDLKVSTMVRNPAAEIGVGLSHLKAITHAINSNAENVLIFEDDIEFADNYNNILSGVIQELPKKWDMLYLGGTPLGQFSKISPNLAKVSNGFMGAYAYCLNKNIFLEFHDFCINNIMKKPYDYSTRWLSEKGNTYTAAPYICIPGKHQTNSTIKKQTNGAGSSSLIKQRWERYLSY